MIFGMFLATIQSLILLVSAIVSRDFQYSISIAYFSCFRQAWLLSSLLFAFGAQKN